VHVNKPGQFEDDVSLADFVGIIRRQWRLFAAITVACTAIAAAAAFLMTPVYQAAVLLAPAKDEQKGVIDSLAGSFGGIAELAGVSLGGGGSSKDEAIALLQSKMLTLQFIQDENLLPVLFARKWDAERGEWDVGDREDIPTLGDGYRLWDEDIRAVETSTTSTLITLTIDWKDRQQAARWATELVRRANELMRERAIAEARRSLEYLNEGLTRTSIVAVQQAIHSVMETQVKTMALAKVREEYYFRVIDPAVVPDADDFVRPQRVLMIIGGFLGGAILALITVIMKNALSAVRRDGQAG
jgi:uncharacterized protein involved in exopolysaccharide biosynthesis